MQSRAQLKLLFLNVQLFLTTDPRIAQIQR